MTLDFKVYYPLIYILISLWAFFCKVHWARLGHFLRYMYNGKTAW
jgi:hypothetical protein